MLERKIKNINMGKQGACSGIRIQALDTGHSGRGFSGSELAQSQGVENPSFA